MFFPKTYGYPLLLMLPFFSLRLDTESFQFTWIIAHHSKDESLVILHEVHNVARCPRLHSVASLRHLLLNVGAGLFKIPSVCAHVHEVSLSRCSPRAYVSCSFHSLPAFIKQGQARGWDQRSTVP